VPKIRYKDMTFRDAAMQMIQRCNQIIETYAEQGFDLTLRQVYYKLVATDMFPDDRTWRYVPETGKWVRDPNGTKNAEPNYNWLGEIINDGRLAGLIDWERIVDRTRKLRKLAHWDSPAEIISDAAGQYRLDRWDGQEFRVEVWVEKDALVGVLEDVCNALDVPYFSCRGYTSQSEMWVAAQRLLKWIDEGYTPLILHLGDHDPSGIDMTRDIKDRLAMFTEQEVEVRRLALTMEQIRSLNPPPNPCKVTDSRAAGYIGRFGRESWELDALEPQYIVDLIRSELEIILDLDKWERATKSEQAQRVLLTAASDQWAAIAKRLKKTL